MKKAIRVVLWIGFAVYCLLLLYFLFFRSRYSSMSVLLTLPEYFRMFTNFVPFKTITEFIIRLQEHTINTSIVVENLLGNLILFLPMGFFIPVLFQKIDRLLKCMVVVFAVIFTAEVLQLLLMVGSFDIDDFMLNTIGSLIGYGIYKIGFVHALVSKYRIDS